MKSFLLKTILLVYCICIALPANAATEFKIITLQHRFAEDLLPSIQPLVGSEGTASGIQNQLIIRTSPENMVQIERVIAALDVAHQNLKITVSHQNNLQNEHDDVTVNGRKRFGNVEIGTTNQNRRPPRDGVQVGIENNQSNSNSTSNQFINVVDGEQAFIRMGQSVPFTQEWAILSRRYVSVRRTTEFVDITTGFAVRPRSIGNQIEVEITPRIAQLNQRGFIDFEELTTVVRMNRGEWLDIGGIMSQKDEVSREILSKQSMRQSHDNQLSIRVD